MDRVRIFNGDDGTRTLLLHYLERVSFPRLDDIEASQNKGSTFDFRQY